MAEPEEKETPEGATSLRSIETRVFPVAAEKMAMDPEVEKSIGV